MEPRGLFDLPKMFSPIGGFYEVFLRLVRKILRSIAGKVTLDKYDLLTLITEIERILNDRPIIALPSHSDGLSAITPAMTVSGSVVDSLSLDIFNQADGCKKYLEKTAVFSRHILGKTFVLVFTATANKKEMVWHYL